MAASKPPPPSPNLPSCQPPNPLNDGAALPPKAEPLDAPKVNPAPAAGAAVGEPKADGSLVAVASVEVEDAVLVKPNDKAAAPAPGAAALELAAVPVLLDVALAPPNEKLAPAICATHRQNIAAPIPTPGQQTSLVGVRLWKGINQNRHPVMQILIRVKRALESE